MLNFIRQNRRILLLLLATIVMQVLICLLAYSVNLIPSWEIGCGIVCVIIYLSFAVVYFLVLRRIFLWLRRGIKTWAAVSLSLLYGSIMLGWLLFSLDITAICYLGGSGTLFESYDKTITLPQSQQEVYLYSSHLFGVTTKVYIRDDWRPMKTKITSLAGSPSEVSITESDSMIYISGVPVRYEYNRYSRQLREVSR